MSCCTRYWAGYSSNKSRKSLYLGNCNDRSASSESEKVADYVDLLFHLNKFWCNRTIKNSVTKFLLWVRKLLSISHSILLTITTNYFRHKSCHGFACWDNEPIKCWQIRCSIRTKRRTMIKIPSEHNVHRCSLVVRDIIGLMGGRLNVCSTERYWIPNNIINF